MPDIGPGPVPGTASLRSPDRDDVWFRVFDAAPLPYALLALDRRQLVANTAYCSLFGYEPDQLADVHILDMTHPEDRDMTEDYLDRLARGEFDHHEVDKRFLRRDGSTFWGHLSISMVRDAHGEPVALAGTVEDVTAQHEVQRALTASESRFRSLVQNAADAIILVDTDAQLLYASPSADTIVGTDTQSLLGQDVVSFIHVDDRLVAAQAFSFVTDTPGVSDPLRMRMVRPDGAVRLVEIVPTNLLDDAAVGAIVMNIRDVTDTAEVASALELTENRFRRMIENISDTVTLVDASANVILSTGNLRSIMGYPTEFWAGRNAFDVVHPDDLARMRDDFARLLVSPGEELSGEVRIRTADGGWIDAEINALNLLEDPVVDAIVLTTRNVTERRNRQQELADARDQAVRALRMRTEFIASVSHELRTPIHGILGLSELLATADLDEEARGLARSIGRATEGLRMVLDDILDFSKIEVGRLEVNEGPFDVAEMAEDLGALFGGQARAKGIELRGDIDPDIPQWILGDALRVRQVLTNLIGNAIKFTAVGSVHVDVRALPNGDGEVGRWIRVEVTDTGIGIPEGSTDQLFEPFSQVHGGGAREFGGTGLGLSIAKRLVQLMGGDLGFESRLGVGSAFWFTLPLVEADIPGAIATDAMREAGSGRVLVVEDNPINQLLVRRQLERLGYDVEVIDNGIAALEAFPAAGADVVLMDWQLPGIDGLETTRRLRRLEHDLGRERTPVVAMTASALPGDRDRCLDAGMDDFIAKPVSIAMLGDVLVRWMPAGDGGAPLLLPPSPPGGARQPAIVPPAAMADPTTSPGTSTTTSTPAGTTERTAGIDEVILDRLAEELADAMLVVTVVRTYLRELPGRVDAICAALAADDRPALVATTHTLKSTSAAVGAVQLAATCLELEQGARLSTPRADAAGRATLEDQAATVALALAAYIGRLERDAGAAEGSAPKR